MSEVLRYLMPVGDMSRDELENALTELRRERIELINRLAREGGKCNT